MSLLLLLGELDSVEIGFDSSFGHGMDGVASSSATSNEPTSSLSVVLLVLSMDTSLSLHIIKVLQTIERMTMLTSSVVVVD